MRNLTFIALTISAALSTQAIAEQNVKQGSSTQAQQQHQLAIPAGMLGQALVRLSAITGNTISVNASLIDNMNSPEINGSFSTQQAINKLIANLPLQLKITRANSFTLIAKPVEQHRENVLATAQVYSKNTTGDDNFIYTESSAPSTTRTDVPLSDTSKSIQVLTSNFINDIEADNLEEVLQYVSGTGTRERLGGVDTQYFIRGFSSEFSYRNGKRDYAEGQVNLNTTETIEVLKGPSSVQFGVNSPGGIVNYTTKKPQAETMLSAKVLLDEHGKRELIADATGSANDANNLLYRLILSVEDSEGYRDNSDSESYTIAPSLTYLLSEKTTFNAALEVTRTKLPVDRGLPIGHFSDGSQAIMNVPKTFALHEIGDVSIDKKTQLDLSLTQQLNTNWRGELSYSYHQWDGSWQDVQMDELFTESGELPIYGTTIPFIAGDTIRAAVGYIDKEQRVHQATAQLFGEFSFAGMQHKITTGIDYSSAENDQIWGTGDTQSPPFFNIFNPIYGQINSDLAFDSNEYMQHDTFGVFANDTIYITDKLIANLALRYNDYDHHEYWDDGYDYRTDDSAVIGNIGLLYKLIPEASIYLSYATSYEPNEAINVIGEVKPTEGKQWELGLKGSTFNDELQYSLVYFDIAQTNIPNEIEIDGRDMYQLVGEQTSQGIEFDANWQVNDDLTILATYTHLDSKISKDLESPEQEGNTPAGQPKRTSALFANYYFSALDPNLSMSFGVRYYDEVPNRNDNEFYLPSYTRIDLAVNYDLSLSGQNSLQLQLGVKNLADKDIFITQNKNDLVAVGTTRTVYGSINYLF